MVMLDWPYEADLPDCVGLAASQGQENTMLLEAS